MFIVEIQNKPIKMKKKGNIKKIKLSCQIVNIRGGATQELKPCCINKGGKWMYEIQVSTQELQ